MKLMNKLNRFLTKLDSSQNIEINFKNDLRLVFLIIDMFLISVLNSSLFNFFFLIYNLAAKRRASTEILYDPHISRIHKIL